MNSIRSSYWFGKNVFITGVNGFIGANLAKRLSGEGANVFGLVRNAKHDTLLFYEKINERVTLIDGDISNKNQIDPERNLEEKKPPLPFCYP